MIVQIGFEGFRNLEDAKVDLGPGTHLFLGHNGAGKTSLLEAIYLIGTTRSFRTSQVADCCRHGLSGFQLKGDVDRGYRSSLEIGWHAGRRRRAVNGNQTSLAEHISVLPVVCWTSNDIDVLVGAPAGRRQLLDRGSVSLRPSAIATITRYRRATQEKRQLLLRGGEELETWNRVLAEAAAELIRLRSEQASRLQEALDEVIAASELGLPPVELRYRCSPGNGLQGPDAIEDELRSISSRERRAQRLMIGPHRDDLEILWDGHPIRRVASAGERKALGLVLLAAQGKILESSGRAPTYLLDDADAELDRERVESLWQIFSSSGQLLATSSRPQIWESLEIDHRWRIGSGSVSEI